MKLPRSKVKTAKLAFFTLERGSFIANSQGAIGVYFRSPDALRRMPAVIPDPVNSNCKMPPDIHGGPLLQDSIT